MADTETTNFNLVKPEVGGSTDTWGEKLNENLDIIDGQMKSNADAAQAAQDSANVSYDNTASGLTATDVQAAIDEVEGQLLGFGQSWTGDLRTTPGRAIGVTYTNNTGRAIIVAATVQALGGTFNQGRWNALVDNILIFQLYKEVINTPNFGVAGSRGNLVFVVPAGQTYRIDQDGSGSLAFWVELV
jgi:hypothetical protein